MYQEVVDCYGTLETRKSHIDTSYRHELTRLADLQRILYSVATFQLSREAAAHTLRRPILEIDSVLEMTLPKCGGGGC